jgi:hypothetical protein
MQKQWAAGAPVIGAASVPSEKPKRSLRLTTIRRVERSAFSLFRAVFNANNYLIQLAARGRRDFKSRFRKGRQITNAADFAQQEYQAHQRHIQTAGRG